MVTIKGKNIQMTKGDSASIEFTLYDGDDIYIAESGDSMRFAMKQFYSDSSPLLIKNIDMSTMTLVINPEDTENLDAPCSYVYDVQVTFANGTIDTVVPNGTLRLLEEVD